MSDTTQSTETVEKKETVSSVGLQDEVKQRVQLLKQEFLETLQKAKPQVSKTTQTADDATDYLYDKLGVLEQHLFNKSNPFDDWREHELKKLNKALTDGRQELVQAIESEFKRNPESVLAFELDQVTDELNNTLANYKYWLRERVDVPLTYQSADAHLYHEPHGVVLIIGDWQNPLTSVLKPAISALAAGNHVILYPDPQTKKIGDALKSLLGKYLDERRVQVINTETSIQSLLDLPINFVYASGQESKLNEISRIAAEKRVPTALSKDGMNVAIVQESADLNHASERIVIGRFTNAGQSSTSPDVVYVHNSVFTDFFVKCKIHIFCYYKTPDKNRDYSRMLNVDYTKYVLDRISEKHEGKLETKIHFALDEKLIEPIIITDPKDNSTIIKDPVRGPVLIIKRYQEFDELVKTLNTQSNINNIYFFSKSIQHKSEIVAKIRNANIYINEAAFQGFNYHLPTGSVGGIYNAKIGGAYGLKTFSLSRVVMETKGIRQFKSLIPPFTADKYKKLHSLDALKKLTVRQGRMLSVGAGLFLGYLLFGGKKN
jgi:NAD-dependent aldehyde dehydrogenases